MISWKETAIRLSKQWTAIFLGHICYNVKRQFNIAYTQLLIPVLEWKLKSEAIDLGFSRREKIVWLLFKLQAIKDEWKALILVKNIMNFDFKCFRIMNFKIMESMDPLNILLTKTQDMRYATLAVKMVVSNRRFRFLNLGNRWVGRVSKIEKPETSFGNEN